MSGQTWSVEAPMPSSVLACDGVGFSALVSNRHTNSVSNLSSYTVTKRHVSSLVMNAGLGFHPAIILNLS